MAHQTEIVINGVTTEVTEFDHSAQEIDDGIDSLHTLTGGATTPQAALANLGAGVRPNLLDNAYFVGGGTGWGVFPVNQRGASGTISTPGYFIDRWKLVSGTVQITAAGLVLNGTMVQVLPASIGSVYTATALSTTGLATCQYDDASRTFAITGTGQTFMFAKLERGAGQTAAYQDADDVWNMLPQPESDYASQLAKCKRCLRIFNQWFKMRASYIDENRVVFTIPGDMRINPTVDGSWGVFQFNQFSPETGFSFAAYNSGDSISFECTKNNHGLTDAWLGVLDDGNAKLVAEL